MKKAIIILTVLVALSSISSFVVAQLPPEDQFYVPGFNLWGVFYLFVIFTAILLLPHMRRMNKGGH